MSHAHRYRVLRDEWALVLASALLASSLLLGPIALPGAVHTWQVSFDVSQSMDVEDVDLDGRTVSRLTLARAAAAELVRALPCGSRVGWSAMVARRAMMLTTPIETCAHYDALLSTLSGVNGSLRWSQGSSIGKGLHQSLRGAQALDGPVALLLLSDGHEAPPLREGASGFPKRDADVQVRGLLGGVGGEVPVRIPKSDERGVPTGAWWSAEEVVQRSVPSPGTGAGEHLSRLDEAHLQRLATLAGLEYVRVDSPQAVVKAALRSRHAARGSRERDLRWIPVALALLLVAWRFAPFGGRAVPGAASTAPVRSALQ